MIVVRNVWQAKYGKGNELVQLLKESLENWPTGRRVRILTDLSGPFFTVVTEAQYTSFGDFEAAAQGIFDDPRFADWFERMTALVEGGRREFYTLAESFGPDSKA